MDPYYNSSLYYKFRPTPPMELIDEILKMLSEKIQRPFQLAVDFGCGSGQMTSMLAPHFTKVIGLDHSLSQLEEAKAKNTHDNVKFQLSSENAIDVPPQSVDLIVASQSVHWFDMEWFSAEVKKLLKPDGVLAIAGYTYPEPLIDSHTLRLFNLIENWFAKYRHLWPPQHDLLLNRYKDLPRFFCYQKRIDPIAIDIDGTMAHLMEHLRSRSGIQKLINENPEEAEKILKKLQEDLQDEINIKDSPPQDIKMTIRFNYFLVMFRKE